MTVSRELLQAIAFPGKRGDTRKKNLHAYIQRRLELELGKKGETLLRDGVGRFIDSVKGALTSYCVPRQKE